ncbi:DUF2865 domain-containing protein [Propylenella binzhouense]|uniref:DUF2865 domain-containing protein n=1 Tax=Propylenella binzhouense TaxID=2555902 RepID=A0A964T3W2_9HYPH|nr:DUF2865 domain-containing protein [Propylenella binzhouense]MYZ47462.1 DUF2865 domain-containing protein [Propylenella binzhouense]
MFRRAILCFALAAMAGGGQAEAASCRALQTELARLQNGGSQSALVLQYQRAYQEQAYVLQQARNRARQAGCFGGGFFIFRAQPQPACRTLLPKIDAMEANLAKLDRLRARAGGAGISGDVRQIRTLMARQGCGREALSSGSESGESLRNLPEAPAGAPGPGAPQTFAGRGTYRTLCVRSCDGYYFPVSFATTREKFASDLETCQALCPGTRVDLYFHPNPGTDSEAMISLAGTPYSEMPNAFKYRRTFDKSCTCGADRPRNFSVVSTAFSAPKPADGPDQTASVDTVAPPEPRPGFGEDPETLDNRAGNYAPKASATAGAVASKEVSPPEEKKIRIVGPAYWGARQKEEVLLTPVPN